MKQICTIRYFCLFCAIVVLVVSAFSTPAFGSAPLTRAFKGFTLGMSVDAFKTEIGKENMNLIGDLDIYMTQPSKNVYAAMYPPLFRKLLFYFFDGKLMLITFVCDPDRMSVYDEYRRLKDKYGPCETNARQFVWSDEQTMLILEKDPFIIKLLDRQLFPALEKSGQSVDQLTQDAMNQLLDTL